MTFHFFFFLGGWDAFNFRPGPPLVGDMKRRGGSLLLSLFRSNIFKKRGERVEIFEGKSKDMRETAALFGKERGKGMQGRIPFPPAGNFYVHLFGLEPSSPS